MRSWLDGYLYVGENIWLTLFVNDEKIGKNKKIMKEVNINDMANNSYFFRRKFDK